MNDVKVAGPVIVAELVVVDGQYVNRSLATASWTDTHRLVPGVYPMELCDVNYVPTPNASRPYFASVAVPTVLVESYRVNRLFTASSSFTEHPNRASSVHVCLYGYAVRDGAKALDGHATVRLLQDHPDRHFVVLDKVGDYTWDERQHGPTSDPVRARCACGAWQREVGSSVEAKELYAVQHVDPIRAANAAR